MTAPKRYTTKQAAPILGVDHTRVQYYILHGLKVGTRRLYLRATTGIGPKGGRRYLIEAAEVRAFKAARKAK